MVDYHKSTGSSGTMRIRDTGTTVEFWITSGNSTTFVNEMPWAYVVNGVTSSWREFRYEAGAGYERLGSWTVSTTQTVTFKLGATGTSGLGGPTNFSVTINRASRPGNPGVPTFSGITGNSIIVSFVDGASNGAAIDSRQIAYNTSNTLTGATIISSDGSTNVTGLDSGTTYIFWARTHNSEGYSNWSSPRSATTLRVPFPPTDVVLSNVTQTRMDISFQDGPAGGSPITSREVAYSTVNDVNTANIVPYTAPTTMLFALEPGVLHYFWARTINSVGDGDWSVVVQEATIAGAYIRDGVTWKKAVPYMKIGGSWWVVEPWVKVAGEWVKTK